MKSKTTSIWLLGWTALLLLPANTAWGSPLAYGAATNGDFGTIDLGSGTFTKLGNSGLQLCGLGEVGAILYGMACASPGNVYSVNPANGSLSLLGPSGLANDDFGSTTTALYASPGPTLYSVNSSTGAATLAGGDGLGSFSGFSNLSTGSNLLYFTDSGALFFINPAISTNATSIGPTGVAVQQAMAVVGGVLYGTDSNDRLYTFNTLTGAGTPGISITGESANFFGMAPVPVATGTPEPGTFPILCIGSIALALLRRKTRMPQSA